MAHRDRARLPALVATTRYIRPHTRDVDPVQKAYLASCDMHNKVHRGEIARERESIFDELKDGEPG